MSHLYGRPSTSNPFTIIVEQYVKPFVFRVAAFVRQRRGTRLLAPLTLFFFFCSLWYLLFHTHHQKHTLGLPYPGPREAIVEKGNHGFLPLSEAKDFCQRRRWEPYGTRDTRRKVYDLFLINTELDFLEIRLNELDKEVDYFVILESATTFQMNRKPLHLAENLSLFKAFSHKIIYRVLDEASLSKIPKDDTWEHERFTRNALFDQVLLSLNGTQAPNQGDVLLVGDIDEIPRLEVLTALRNCAFPPRITLHTQMYYYSFQWLHRGTLWHHPQATFYNGPGKTIRPEDLRSHSSSDDRPPDAELYMAGWHCSSCFSRVSELQNKIESFSHKGYNQPYYLDQKRLLRQVRRGEDLFERAGEMYDRIDNNLDVPVYMRGKETREKFKYMLDRDPANGNFKDL